MAKKLYTVQNGDYLQKIAAEQLGDWKRWVEIAYINSIPQPYIVRVNDIIALPDDSEPLDIVIPFKPNQATAAQSASAFQFSPATVALFAFAAVAYYILTE